MRKVLVLPLFAIVAAGLSFRPTEVTAKDTLEWFRSLSEDPRTPVQRILEREAQVIAAWRARA